MLGEKCYPNLEAVRERIDIVDCFRKSEDIDVLVPTAISINAKVLWMQLGVQNKLAAKKITDAGNGLRTESMCKNRACKDFWRPKLDWG